MTAGLGLRSGMLAALPIVAAYLPISFALGAASSKLNFSVFESALWSGIMFSGANQALLLSGVTSGVPLSLLTVLAIAVSFRHTLYGVALRGKLRASVAGRATFAYGLTDEVFATALAAYNSHKRILSSCWLVGLSLFALGAWVLGTALGSAVGDVLKSHISGIDETLNFALPALFVGLLWSVTNTKILHHIILAGSLSTFMILLGHAELAIPAGALAIMIPERNSR